MRFSVPTVVTAAALVALLLASVVTYQVRFNEKVIKLRFGKADESSVQDKPGLYLRWPPPVESVVKYDTRLQTLDTPETEIKTLDGQNIIVGAFAVWHIKDPLLFYKRVGTMGAAQEKLLPRIGEVRVTVIGQHNLAEFVNLDPEVVDRNYAALEKQMIDTAGPGILTDYGVELVQLGLRRISLPGEATQKVQESMIAERNKKAETYKAEGRGQADAIRARADSTVKQILSFATRRAVEIESAGTAASTRILEQIGDKDSDFFIYLRWLEALQNSFKNKGTIFIDWDTEVGRRFAFPFTGSVTSQPAAKTSDAGMIAEPGKQGSANGN